MNSQQVQDMRLMYEAVYNDELWELANEYNNTIYDEDIVEVATEYFYTYGLNENGIDILIEKVGLDNFVEFVYDLSEDLTILTEERSAKRRTGKSHADVLAKIDAKEAAKKKAKEEAQKRKESERMEPASNGADTESKKEQPKSKKPIRDAIARRILAGMERHREATQTAGRLAGETGRTLGRIVSLAGEAGHRGVEHVKKHGMKSLANSYEYDTFDAILEHLVAEGYADTNESALAIMANMSDEWREEILDEANEIMSITSPEGKRKKVNRTYPSDRASQNAQNARKLGALQKRQRLNPNAMGPRAARRQATDEVETNTRKSISRLNAAKNIEDKQADGDYENTIDHSKPYGKGKSGYMEVPTDYRARNRRARGR